MALTVRPKDLGLRVWDCTKTSKHFESNALWLPSCVHLHATASDVGTSRAVPQHAPDDETVVPTLRAKLGGSWRFGIYGV